MRRSSSSGSASRSRALLGLLLVALAAGDAAAAKKRVVVIPFSGPGAGPAEAAVTRVVRRRHSVVPAQKYTAMKKKLGLSKPTDRNVARISARLKVDAVVVGTVERSRGRFKLTVRVREGKSGEFAETITLPLKSRRLSKRAAGATPTRRTRTRKRTNPTRGRPKRTPRRTRKTRIRAPRRARSARRNPPMSRPPRRPTPARRTSRPPTTWSPTARCAAAASTWRPG
jgi:hypothetical protein